MIRATTPIQFERSRYPEVSLHGRIVHAIGRRILGGNLRPGALLPAERELRAAGRSCAEAVKVLAAKGLVESRPKTGTRVRARDAWNLLDPDVLAWQQGGQSLGQPGRAGTPAKNDALLRKLTEVRRIIEPAAAELRRHTRGRPRIAAIEEAWREMEQAALSPPGGDFDAFVQADMRFISRFSKRAERICSSR